MLYVIGLGLGDEKDITVKGLEIVKKCERVYLENYTSVLVGGAEGLASFYGKDVTLADRTMVESGCGQILDEARTADVAFLVVGDPFGATTHSDLLLRASEQRIRYQIIHNASIMNAVGAVGLQLYNYGKAVSIVFWEGAWQPDSFYDKIKENKQQGMHSLILLDIKVKEPDLEQMMRGKTAYMPPSFMTITQATSQLLEIEERRNEGVCTRDTLGVGVARLGSATQKIVAAPLEELKQVDFGPPLHSMIIPGQTHEIEDRMLELWRITKS